MTFEAINGDESYRANAKAMVTDLQAHLAAKSDAYESLVAAVIAKADEFRRHGSQWHAEQLDAVLDGHLKEKS
ncbi:hypothetical protein ACIRON_03000 [Nocardioides sp. NPDC101246]|uniref:hypothetical protein n=1 Tax=Nocardioides sp. NPDC101246 TaxID=3364336 RepID=UPI003813C229